jgi:hypothetical protein
MQIEMPRFFLYAVMRETLKEERSGGLHMQHSGEEDTLVWSAYATQWRGRYSGTDTYVTQWKVLWYGLHMQYSGGKGIMLPTHATQWRDRYPVANTVAI